jgi:iduronate 2-sulfatase
MTLKIHLLLSFLFFILTSIYVIASNSVRQSLTHEPTNILFIMYDDLRPQLSIYGVDYMITPNFERLAARSVVFDNAYCQIAVCNPSRDSLLTGLRPDTVGTFGFQHSFRPHVTFPSILNDYGYRTAGFGKVVHWDGNDRNIWTEGQWGGEDWYDVQNKEYHYMNASIMPDIHVPEEKFRDYEVASHARDMIRNLHQKDEYFMVAMGFKLPHLSLHFPYKYFDMYRNRTEVFHRPKRELRFPITSPKVAHKCCANADFVYLAKDGSVRSHDSVGIAPIDFQFPSRMHMELMWGYCASVTFLDTQLGRMLDLLDELELWNNITIILTADHGMHNGEKGMW